MQKFIPTQENKDLYDSLSPEEQIGYQNIVEKQASQNASRSAANKIASTTYQKPSEAKVFSATEQKLSTQPPSEAKVFSATLDEPL